MTRTLVRSHAVVALVVTLSCGPSTAYLDAPAEAVVGDEVSLVMSGLEGFEKVTMEATLTDAFQRTWRARADFSPDADGHLLLPPPEVFEFLAGAEMDSVPENWEAPEAREFNSVLWRVTSGDQTIATEETRFWIFPPGIQRQRLGGELVAELFTSPGRAPAPGVLLLGGSGGGMGWAQRSAALLARAGFAALAVAYFNEGDLPKALIEIPLEYVDAALDSLKLRPEVDPSHISMVGYSKGAELALLVASRRGDITSVVAFAPGSAVFQGFRRPDFPVLSSWSLGGIGLPFVRNAYDDRFFETFDGMYLWYRTLAQDAQLKAAAIPVESIRGDILLISGVDDRIWPSTLMGEQIVARLGRTVFDHEVHHLAFPRAGHGIAAPPGEPLTSVSERLGGTVEGNLYARRLGWNAMLAFLTRPPS